jgi:hypothetical protein
MDSPFLSKPAPQENVGNSAAIFGMWAGTCAETALLFLAGMGKGSLGLNS